MLRLIGERLIAAAEKRGLDYEIACGFGVPIALGFGYGSWAMPPTVKAGFEYFAVLVGGVVVVFFVIGLIKRLFARPSA